jgi:hypothetical protein
MSYGQRAAVRCVPVAAWLLASAVSVSTSCAINGKPARSSPTSMIGICRPRAELEQKEAIVTGGYVGGDAKVHLTVAIAKGVEQPQERAFSEALRRWNEWSEVTRMVLEDAAPGGPIDITLKMSTDPKAHCAVHHPSDSSVGYAPKGAKFDMEFAEKDHMLAARAYVHEMGHVFGIHHPNDGGLMDPSVYSHESENCAVGAGKIKSISRRDAENARDCAFAAHVGHQYRLPPK